MRPKKKISQSDIAKALGISNVSVSNALAGRKGVSQDLTQKVWQKAEKMGYDTGEDAPDCQSGLLFVVSRSGPGADTEERFQKILRDQKVRVKCLACGELLDPAGGWGGSLAGCLGVLADGPLSAQELLALKEKSGGPVVGLGFFDSRVPIDYVMDDGFHGAQSVVQYLRSQKYETILYVMPEEAGQSAGYAAAWVDRLLGCRSELYLETLHRGATMHEAQPFDIEESRTALTFREACGYLENRRTGVRKQESGQRARTVFFCGDMRTARAFLRELKDRQIRVPEDIAVAGYAVGEDCALQAGREQITAYTDSEKNLLDLCCAVLRHRRRCPEAEGNLHLAAGDIMEGSTA